ncbi:SPRY domain-containing SOCS box protein 3-like [Dreissena polymorpha]|uniref:SPRY domain-containing SOCS box protein 3 n=2 Tax=Dreissena polymorpha TaxID=45954 RepID=A0A9D4M8F2_DREPO|nr:SPRY domain-containing SOCS box protein 3-like [Dreissena polymorpha]KAH3871773.1 hypothetical protein DPMN_034987 [Dreissena polymorpha]
MDAETDEYNVADERPSSSSAELDYESDESGETGDGSDRDEVLSQLSVSSVKPVKGESFCDCYKTGREKECVCGEDDSYFEWTWDSMSKSAASFLKHDQREVVFHVDYSCGTAAVRGNQPMVDDQYYWEVKMTTPVYGTDMMVGVGTVDLDLNKYRHKFCSLVGRDGDSWGLSYTGMLHNKGQKLPYASKFGQGTIIGVHLDMWHGTLSFYKNRKPLGIAYRGLQGKKLYPVVSSTAARSGMKVIKCRSFKTSLQFMCCQVLRTVIPRHLDVLQVIAMPPGLREFLENNISWLLQPNPVERLAPSYSDVFRSRGTKRKYSSSEEDCDDGPSSSKSSR